jgi:transposase-like protein
LDAFKAKKKSVNKSWRVDETYVKVKGKWCYLYSAVDRFGDTIDFLLSKNMTKKLLKNFLIKPLNLLEFQKKSL